jgi:hypothetical protein
MLPYPGEVTPLESHEASLEEGKRDVILTFYQMVGEEKPLIEIVWNFFVYCEKEMNKKV